MHSWKANTIATPCRSPPLIWIMLIFEGPDQRSSRGFHGVEGFSVGPSEENYRCYRGWIPTTGTERISDTVVFFPLQRYTYDLPAPPTQEEVVQEAAKAIRESLRTLATNNPTYMHLSNFSGLQQMSDLINLAAKKSFRRQDAGKTEGDPTKHSRRT